MPRSLAPCLSYLLRLNRLYADMFRAGWGSSRRTSLPLASPFSFSTYLAIAPFSSRRYRRTARQAPLIPGGLPLIPGGLKCATQGSGLVRLVRLRALQRGKWYDRWATEGGKSTYGHAWQRRLCDPCGAVWSIPRSSGCHGCDLHQALLDAMSPVASGSDTFLVLP